MANILPFSLNFGGSTPSQTVLLGETAVRNMIVSPVIGIKLSAITLTTSGFPAGATSIISPKRIASNDRPTNVTLSI
jgi:hypothetical protein